MASQKQIEANRNNARRSTGPRTAVGKAKVALNAVTHGLTAIKVIAGAEENADVFEALRAQLNREWRPGSVLEVILVDRIAELIWQLRRAGGVEVKVIEDVHVHHGVNEPPPPVVAKMARDLSRSNGTLLRVQMYQNRLERALHRSIRELRLLQIERQMQDEREDVVDDFIEADSPPAPLPGERLGEGMQRDDTQVTPEEVADKEGVSPPLSVADAPTSTVSASPHLTSPQGEGPESATPTVSPLPSVVDAPTSPDSASPHLTSPQGEGQEGNDKTNPIAAVITAVVSHYTVPRGHASPLPLPFRIQANPCVRS